MTLPLRTVSILRPRIAPGVLLALLVLGVLLAPSARACMCVPPPPPAEALEQVDAVFTGRVTEVAREDVQHAHGTLPRVRVEMEVLACWKGLREEELEAGRVTLYTGTGGGDCGYDFAADAEYLVYAWRDEKGDGEVRLSTDICTRTRKLQDAADDLEALGEPAHRAEGCAGS